MKRWGIIVAVLAMMSASCEGGQPGWLLGFQPVDEHVVTTIAGAQHCQSQDSTFLVVGWPLGTAEGDITAARWYVRNPPAFMKQELLADFEWSVTPPKDARYTNYHNGTFELWLAPSDQNLAAYIKTEGHFELWPLARSSLMCR